MSPSVFMAPSTEAVKVKKIKTGTAAPFLVSADAFGGDLPTPVETKEERAARKAAKSAKKEAKESKKRSREEEGSEPSALPAGKAAKAPLPRVSNGEYRTLHEIKVRA